LRIEAAVPDDLALEHHAARQDHATDIRGQTRDTHPDFLLEFRSEVFVGVHSHGPRSHVINILYRPIKLGRLSPWPKILNYFGPEGTCYLTGFIGGKTVDQDDS
jgi:hypothetical protein